MHITFLFHFGKYTFYQKQKLQDATLFKFVLCLLLNYSHNQHFLKVKHFLSLRENKRSYEFHILSCNLFMENATYLCGK